MKSPNMNYRYNVEYFNDVIMQNNGTMMFPDSVDLTNRNHTQIVGFSFPVMESIGNLSDEIPGTVSFDLHISYPGMMIGTGNLHQLPIDGVFKNGFTFDHVTGLPYIPGSSLKGVLKNYFPSEECEEDIPENPKNNELNNYIKQLLNNNTINPYKLSQFIFGDNDNAGKAVFIGGWISNKINKLLDMEYITPHKGEFMNPVPISMIKVKPGVKFKFIFILKDYIDGEIVVSVDEQKELFKNILLDSGVGAKTNVGFGTLKEKRDKRKDL